MSTLLAQAAPARALKPDLITLSATSPKRDRSADRWWPRPPATRPHHLGDLLSASDPPKVPRFIMRTLRPLLVPALLGLTLLIIALVTRSGKFARDNPGEPINSAMREAMHMMTLPPADEAEVLRRFPTATITHTGLRYVVTQPGDGVTHPARGQAVLVHYRGNFLDGTYLDDSFKRNEPYGFVVGKAQVIPGWDEAILDMTKGEKRTLIIPYWLGYGDKGIKGHIPPKTTLVFEVELVDLGPQAH